MFRHGDRNPITQNPGDKYDISYFPAGWGQLTNVSFNGNIHGSCIIFKLILVRKKRTV